MEQTAAELQENNEVIPSHKKAKVVNKGLRKLNVIDRTNNKADSFPGEKTLLVIESFASLQKRKTCSDI